MTALILAAAGTMAVAGSLQVIYERVFGQPHRGWRDVLRFATWAGVLFGVLVAESVIYEYVRAGGPVAQGLVTYVGTAAFFWWTMYFLLAGRVSWRRLLPSAVLTALLWIGLGLFSAVYFSAAVISDSRLYGMIGVVFTLLIWFIAIGAVIVLGATRNLRKGRPGVPGPDHPITSTMDPAVPTPRAGNTRALPGLHRGEPDGCAGREEARAISWGGASTWSWTAILPRLRRCARIGSGRHQNSEVAPALQLAQIVVEA